MRNLGQNKFFESYASFDRLDKIYLLGLVLLSIKQLHNHACYASDKNN